MPSDQNTQENESEKKALQRTPTVSMQLGAAMELPFSFVGSVCVGGFIGYLLDRWLHTGPWLLVVFGCFGFVAGILEIIRRFNPKGPGKNDGRASS